MGENALLSSQLEPTNEHAIAKIAGIKLCESYNRQFGQKFGVDYRSVMPTNLYGLAIIISENSHVIPGLIRRFHEQKLIKLNQLLFGVVESLEEFLYVEDMAQPVCML